MMHRHPDLDRYLRTLGRDVTPLPEDPAYTEDYPLDWPDAPLPIDDRNPPPLTPADRMVQRLAAAWLFFGACVITAIVTSAWRAQ